MQAPALIYSAQFKNHSFATQFNLADKKPRLISGSLTYSDAEDEITLLAERIFQLETENDFSMKRWNAASNVVGSSHLFLCWMLHGSTKFGVRAVALQSAN